MPTRPLFLSPPRTQQMGDPIQAGWNTRPPKDDSDLVRLIDFAQLNQVFDDFLEVVGLPVAIIDLNGRVLASSRWHRICLAFHRANPDTRSRCIESDTTLAAAMREGRDSATYRCRNGLTDCASPIVVEGQHVANLFTGQFLLVPADARYFEDQASAFGFEREAYFQALAEVPVVAEEKLPAILRFLTGFAQQIANLTLARKRDEVNKAELEQRVESRTRELYHSSQMLQLVLDTVPLRVFWKSRDLEYLGGNQAFAEDAGLADASAVPGKTDFDLRWRGSAASVRADDRRVMEAGVAKIGREEAAACPDGTTTWTLTNKMPLRDPDGTVVGLLGTSEDITAMKAVQESLRESKELAESANRAKSDFLASMSHELRTPLNAVLGFAQLMQRDPDFPARHRENLEIVNRSGEYLLAMINDVLDMSKIEAGRMAVELEPFDLPQILEDISAMIRVRAQAKGLSFVLDRSPALPRYVRTDVRKLRQILINVLGNAVKYTDRGSVVLRARALVEPPEACWLEIEVQDTGRGIAGEELPHVFEAFVQAGRKSPEGSGLGLAITKRFVELLRGRIGIESALGVGSVLTIGLPVELAAESDVIVRQALRRVTGLAPGEHPRRVLIVEDNEPNRRLLRLTLEGVGFMVEEAKNGEDAIDVCRGSRPDLVLLDIRMPVLDGTEAARRIRALDESAACKIIAVTASAFREEREEIVAAGFDGLLLKPFRASDMFAMIERLLGVRFDYADPAPTALETRTREVTRAEILALPAEWRERFHRAARVGKPRELQRLLLELPAGATALAEALKDLLDRYDLERLAGLTEPET